MIKKLANIIDINQIKKLQYEQVSDQAILIDQESTKSDK